MARRLTTGEKAKAVGSGLLKTITSWFTDDKGKFSWKQTLKTVAVGAAIVAATAVAVAALPVVLAAAGITLSAAAAGTIVTTAVAAYGVYQAGKEVKHGYDKVNNANSSKEAYDGIETASKGLGDGVLAVVGARGMKKGVSSVSEATDMAIDAAKMTGKTKFGASVDGMKAGLKTSAVQTASGVKNTAVTVKDVVAHPVRTVKAIHESAVNGVKSHIETRRVKAKIKDAKTKEDYVALKDEVQTNEKLSESAKAKITKKIDKKTENADDANLTALYKNVKRNHVNKLYGERIKAKYENAVKNSQSVEQLNKLKAELPKDDPIISSIDARIKTLKENATNEFNAKVNAENDFAHKSGILRRGKTQKQKLLDEAEKKFKGDKENLEKAQNAIEDRAELLQEIDELGKHPSYEEYKDILSRVEDGDAYTLNILKKKLTKDRFINGRDITRSEKAEIRGEIYRKLNNKSEAFNAAAREMNAEEFNEAKNEFDAGKQGVNDSQADLAIADDRISSAIGHKKVAESHYRNAQDNLATLERNVKLDELKTQIQGDKEALQEQYPEVLDGYKAQETVAMEKLDIATKELGQATEELNALRTKLTNKNKAPFEKLVEKVAVEFKKNGKYKYKTIEELKQQASDELLSGKHINNLKQKQVVDNYKNALELKTNDPKLIAERKVIEAKIETTKQNVRDAQSDYNGTVSNRQRTENEIETVQKSIKEYENRYDFWSKKISEAKIKADEAKTIYDNESQKVALLESNKEVSVNELASLKQNLLKLKKDYDMAKANMDDLASQSAKEVVKYMSSKVQRNTTSMHYLSGVPLAKPVSSGIASINLGATAPQTQLDDTSHDNELVYADEAADKTADKTDEHDSELKTAKDDTSSSETAESTDPAATTASDKAVASTDPAATSASTTTAASKDPAATTASTTTVASTTPAATTASTTTVAPTTPATTVASTTSVESIATPVVPAVTVAPIEPATIVSTTAVAPTESASTTVVAGTLTENEKPKLSDWDVLDLTVQLQNARTNEDLDSVISQFNNFDFSNFNRLEAFQRLLKSKQEQIETKNFQIYDMPVDPSEITDEDGVKIKNNILSNDGSSYA